MEEVREGADVTVPQNGRGEGGGRCDCFKMEEVREGADVTVSKWKR